MNALADVRKACAMVVVAAVAGVLVLGFSGGSPVAAHRGSGAPGATFTLIQMNLCLSGLADCYAKVAYPAGVRDAVTRIDQAQPNAVTLNEACRNDVVHIARRTGYHMRFSRVLYRGKRLRCSRPAGRGLFGDAVLTKAAIESTD